MDYPEAPLERSRWIERLRPGKNTLDPRKPYAFFNEEEADSRGVQIPMATLFLTNKECPFRCLMCDLWMNTLDANTKSGDIPAQIAFGLEALGFEDSASRVGVQVKLYNSGSFFDPSAIPVSDYEEISWRLEGFERVIVECHPAFIGERTLKFQKMLSAKLEVAVGLETAHPEVLERLNKRITVGSFRDSAHFLKLHDIALRVFILLRPPFLSEEEGVLWAKKSLDFSMECCAEVMCVIPTRGGNGAMELLSRHGFYSPPSLESLEIVMEYGLAQKKGRIYADLWDIEKFANEPEFAPRVDRLAQMNRRQTVS